MSAHRGSAWPVGYRRPKDSTAWITQVVWAVGTAAGALALSASAFPAAAILVLTVGLLTVVWIEYETRCEDRRRVLLVFGGIMVLIAILAARNRRHQN